MTSTTGGGMGTQESSSEGVPRWNTDISGDNGMPEEQPGEQPEPDEAQLNEPEPSRARPTRAQDEASAPAVEPRPDQQQPAGQTPPDQQQSAGQTPLDRQPAGQAPPDRQPAGPDRSAQRAQSSRRAGQPIEAHFANPRRQRPQRYNRGRSKVHPTTPLDPITPYMAGPVPRRRKSDWPILVFALIVAAIVMAACCVAGFAIFRTYGLSF